MTASVRTIDSPAGPCGLRPERLEDEPFLRRLFDVSRVPDFRAAGLADAQIDTLMGLQFRAQTGSYRAQFPHGRFWIVELDGAPVGRLVEDDQPGVVYVVDIAVLPAHQGRGIAAALVGELQQAGVRERHGVTAKVLATNTASLRLFGKLGFVVAADDAAPYLDLAWRPPAP
jgi:ribosomal protein S18 acetylase RimI-like enzyme